MTIIRTVHNRENPFVQINKEALWNPNLSLKAVGLWSRCMSRPDDWRFNVKELVTKCKEGRKAIDSAIKELIKENYAIKLGSYEKSDDGKFSGKDVEYIFFEFPATEEEKQKYIEEFKKSFRHCGFGNLREGNFQKDELLIKTKTDTDKKKKEREGASPPIPPPPLFSFKRVKMDQEKYESLVKAFGEPRIKEFLERLDEYADLNPKRFRQYACHAAVIRKWIREDKPKEVGKTGDSGQSSGNRKLAEIVSIKFANHPIFLGNDYLEFQFGPMRTEHLKFKDHGFREQVLNSLRKMGLPIEGL